MLRALRLDHQSNIHTVDLLHIIKVYLWKDNLLFDAEAVISARVKSLRAQSIKIPNPEQCNVDQSIKKFVHTIATQSYANSDRHFTTKFEV